MNGTLVRLVFAGSLALFFACGESAQGPSTPEPTVQPTAQPTPAPTPVPTPDPALRAGACARVITPVVGENHTDPIYWTAYNQGDSSNPLIQSLTEDIVFSEDYCRPSPDMKNYIWVGPKGTRSGLHFDPYNVLFVQVVGKKKILLLPPQDIPKCYLENDFFAQVDAENPDLTRFPKFAECRPLEVEVGPGETLLIPVGWLHQVISLSVSFSVSITCLKLPGGESNHYEAPSLFRGVL